MQGLNQGLLQYPGIEAWENVSITDVAGISPSVALITMYPQVSLPDPEGDLVLTYNDETVIFRNMHIDAMEYHRGSGGKVVTLRLIDERWAWTDTSITLRANLRLPNGFVDPNHEKTPQQLASQCFEALDVDHFDVSALPNDARPEIDWDYANPAQELAKLCDDLGCRIIPRRSNGSWAIVVTGEGADLPEDAPYNDAGEGIDPKETPDYLKIVSAPTLYQYAVRLEPVGKEIDLSWEALGDLSYAPGGNATDGYGFGNSVMKELTDIDHRRQYQPDGTRLSPYELASQTIFRAWRIADDAPYQQFATGTGQPPDASNATIKVPGYENNVFRKQIVLTNQLVQSYTDVYGEDHKRPSFLFGLYRGDLSGSGSNYPFGRRLDAQQASALNASLEEKESFSLAIDPVDSDKSIVMISKPMMRVTNPSDVAAVDLAAVIYGPALLWLMTAVQVRDLETWQPVRNEYLYQIGEGTNKDFCLTIIKNDIQPWYITTYVRKTLDDNGVDLAHPVTTNNRDQVNQQSLYYAQSIAKTFATIQTATRTYIGIYQIDLDGAIQQVSYRMGRDGSSTIASKGTEHDFDIPDYWTRRQRDGTRGIQELMKLQQEIESQRNALRGSFNT